jgi:hypothetical protein
MKTTLTATQHTPGPYYIDDGFVRIDEQASILVDDVGTEREWVAIGPGDEDNANRPAEVVALCHPANAAHIVRCVNSHESLVNALEMALTWMRTHQQFNAVADGGPLSHAIAEVKQVLDRAKA